MSKSPSKLKLSLKKETLRPLQDKEMDLLDSVVGGTGCGATCNNTCDTTDDCPLTYDQCNPYSR